MTNKTNKKISIIVPVFNPGKYFIRCMESLLNQTYENIEIILIDDGSTDGSETLCDQFAQKDHRVISIHQKNSGVSTSRNKGLDCCSGDYIHFMDSDDFLEGNTYEVLANCIQKENCDAAVCEYYVDYPNRSIQHSLSLELYRMCTGEEAAARLFSGFQFACNKLFSKKLITGYRSLPGIRFREDIYRGEDTLFAAEALLGADKVLYINTPLYHYVQSEESACRGRFRISQLSIIKLYEAYEQMYKKYDRDIPKVLWTYLHDNLITIYYDMWSDPSNLEAEEKQINASLREHFKQAYRAAGKDYKKKIKFFLATFFPNLFCAAHKIIHKL